MQKFALMTLVSILVLLGCQKGQNTAKKQNLDTQKLLAKNLSTDNKGLSTAKAILKTVHGNVIFRFYPKEAPNTVTRVIQLIQSGFYDSLTFHRVVPKFVIQTGDPTATGTGGSGQRLKAEFNSIQHIKGTVAMARAGHDNDSADSQFYIALSTLSHLDEKYTVFAQVVEGLDVLDKVVKGDKILSLSLEL